MSLLTLEPPPLVEPMPDRPRIRVAILGDYPRDPSRIVGGVEAVLSYLISELCLYDDLDLHLISLREDVAAREVVNQGQYVTHYLPASYRLGNVTFFAVNQIRLRRELSRLQPDLVHAHIAGTYAEAADAAGVPVVLTQHGMRHRSQWLDQGWFNRWVRRPLIAREELDSLKRARHLIAISPYLQQAYGHLLRARIYPIENPIANKFFAVRNREVPGRILFAGRVDGNKSVHLVIQALPEIVRRAPEAHLHIAGAADEDAYWTQVQHQVRTLGLEARVTFLGQLAEEQLLAEYEACAVFVLPSRLEMSPMAIQQAMAAGKPVVGTRVGGIPYLVAHEQTGLLVDYGDVPALASALARLLTDHELRIRFGAEARAQAEVRFQAKRVAEKTVEVYRALNRERSQR